MAQSPPATPAAAPAGRHGLIIAGSQPGAGKTAVMALLLAGLRERKIPVQPFTAGPWFIDGDYHGEAAGAPCLCLDTWLMGTEGVRQKLREKGAGHVSVIEAQGGLFDGPDLAPDAKKLAELRSLARWPVLLVVPAHRATRSLIAAIRELREEQGPDILAGVIMNQMTNVAQHAHFAEALAGLNLPLIGQVQAVPELYWPRRYLGLTPRVELEGIDLTRLGPLALRSLNVTAIAGLAAPAPAGPKPPPLRAPSVRVGVAQDEAFHFYYPANLEFLRQHGVELVPFSPLRDSRLPPDLHGLLLGSGFPELFSQQLSGNALLRLELARAVKNGMPCYAEGGGLMLLSEAIITLDGKSWPMCGVIPGPVELTNQDQSVGYCVAHGYGVDSEKTFRGHEFHYSRWLGQTAHANLWSVRNLKNGTTRMEGFRGPALHASYVNLYFPTAPEVILRALHLECPEPVRVTASFKQKTAPLPGIHRPASGPLPPAPALRRTAPLPLPPNAGIPLRPPSGPQS